MSENIHNHSFLNNAYLEIVNGLHEFFPRWIIWTKLLVVKSTQYWSPPCSIIIKQVETIDFTEIYVFVQIDSRYYLCCTTGLKCQNSAPQTLVCVTFTILVSFSRYFFEEKKISNNVDFSLWGNRATTQNTFFDIFKWDQNHENHT